MSFIALSFLSTTIPFGAICNESTKGEIQNENVRQKAIDAERRSKNDTIEGEERGLSPPPPPTRKKTPPGLISRLVNVCAFMQDGSLERDREMRKMKMQYNGGGQSYNKCFIHNVLNSLSFSGTRGVDGRRSREHN